MSLLGSTVITISKLKFSVPYRYEAGHALTAGEADALNQTFHENIRNNMASKIEKAPAGTTVDTLQAMVTDYANSYQFGVRPKLDVAAVEANAMLKFAKSQGFESVEALKAHLAGTPAGKRSKAA